MSLTHIDDPPAHALFVHFIVAMVPLTVVAAVVCMVQLRFARRIGLALPLMGLATVALVPITAHAGECLQVRVGNDPLVHKHTH